ncbi:hypothetical protein GWI33_013555 [Rhynchophorus ferrugineus]|uniref:Reverse transcriptase n=1 Tax=Rhynchophorus ferrugineus TaxID=354439 RepID=A0A834M9U5_RHYFE|nr:hypothetical protein GWI33_013555 [Rhynchophorus ferrugineus]
MPTSDLLLLGAILLKQWESAGLKQESLEVQIGTGSGCRERQTQVYGSYPDPSENGANNSGGEEAAEIHQGLSVEGHRIVSKDALKYMGVWLDRGLRMTTHVRKLRERAETVINVSLTRITPRVGGPGASRKRLLATTVLSAVLYAAPIWTRALKFQHYEQVLERVNRRLAIRDTAAYRRVATEAVLVLAGIPPIKLRVKERTTIYRDGKKARTRANQELVPGRQERWNMYGGWACWNCGEADTSSHTLFVYHE